MDKTESNAHEYLFVKVEAFRGDGPTQVLTHWLKCSAGRLDTTRGRSSTDATVD